MTPSFKDGSFAERFTKMGDEAEGNFERYATEELKLGFVRFGLDRPPIQMQSLPARVRYTPDYLMSRSFVEVQGVGRDQLVKLKIDKMGALHHWHDIRTEQFHGVRFYLWDTTNKRECILSLTALDAIVGAGNVRLNSFPEGKSYFEFDAQDIFDAA